MYIQASPIQLGTPWRLAVQENGRCNSHESVWSLFDEQCNMFVSRYIIWSCLTFSGSCTPAFVSRKLLFALFQRVHACIVYVVVDGYENEISSEVKQHCFKGIGVRLIFMVAKSTLLLHKGTFILRGCKVYIISIFEWRIHMIIPEKWPSIVYSLNFRFLFLLIWENKRGP
jgi:hypothetical protein